MSEAEEKKWAPWWVYVVLIIAASLGVRQLIPADAGIALNAGGTLVAIGGTYWLITVVYRSLARRS